MKGLWQITRPSYTTHTPKTVTPVSLTNMAQVPRNKARSRKQGDTVDGKESDKLDPDILLQGEHEKYNQSRT